jgi:hypothetical protein
VVSGAKDLEVLVEAVGKPKLDADMVAGRGVVDIT